MTPASDAVVAEGELTITRIFDAPRPRIFRLWTQPAHVLRWWGPRGYATLSCEIDLRPGGAWRVTSRHAGGAETAERGVFRAIVEPERLVFTHAWEREDGGTTRETLVTVDFAEIGQATAMTFRQSGLGSAADRDGHLEGWSESFDMLAEHLADA